jgi:acyl carrier protein
MFGKIPTDLSSAYSNARGNNRVIPAVAEALAIDVEEVQSSQTFFVDLQGDSLAWLDLSFRLDKEFRVRIPGLAAWQSVATDAEGRITAEGLTGLRALMPASLIDRIQDVLPAPTFKELAEQITVDDIAGMVEMAIESKAVRSA